MRDVKVGDRVWASTGMMGGHYKWCTVSEITTNSGIGHRNPETGTVDWKPGFKAGPVMFSFGDDDTIRVWDKEIYDSAVARVAHMKGALIAGESAPSNEPRVRTSHAGHDHPNTPSARAACRKAHL